MDAVNVRKDIIRVGIIGFGKAGKRHLRILSQIPYFKVVAICDQNKASYFGFANGNLKYYEDINDFLSDSDIDVNVIATPNFLHFEHTVLSLQNGKNVICEKPLCLNSLQVQEIKKIAYASQRKVLIVSQQKHSSIMKKIYSLYKNKNLGRLKAISINILWNRDRDYFLSSDWRSSYKLSGGILFNQFVHFIDVINMFASNVTPVSAVFTQISTQGICNYPDTTSITLTSSDNVYINFFGTIGAEPSSTEGSITFIFSKATIKIGGVYLNSIVEVNPPQLLSLDIRETNEDKFRNFYLDILNILRQDGFFFDEDNTKSIRIIEEINSVKKIIPSYSSEILQTNYFF